ncbi:hypothetical protein HOP50_01g07590 [Chloropicon primus]|uniref:Uncharacterized protein n=1 Tax=Chloropicon primus TaxID=1764295 RepID=A0A5B8MCS7_9CHLO|nr:hypothetical protein A3770_01p07750 [Chloropicon primus]UPQ97468.1 hypothetical protein HOP50_01g07590 [Chloropicon primus]|mmetsp:Transcript_12559/g.35028  ORF Transcript_12559/g.35028 Transcript_12559/m.35028 type:complete len:106 (-) Transcript_12559:104-421(-)|eukprot:QDZ18257.1 hypothetical protein A3770_01p07750 [Chloropicon primus]
MSWRWKFSKAWDGSGKENCPTTLAPQPSPASSSRKEEGEEGREKGGIVVAVDPFDPACPLSDEERRRMLETHNKWVKSMSGMDKETRARMVKQVGKRGLAFWEDT